MILRRWTARATAEGARQYEAHFRAAVLPELAGVDGHHGAYLLQRAADDGGVEIIVMTLWASMDAIRGFAGEAADQAVVEPRAREVLDKFDETVSHHEVVVDTVS